MENNNFSIDVDSIIVYINTQKFNGTTNFYVDDMVVIKDQALWTSNFTPPDYYLTGPKALADGEIVLNPLYSASVFDY